MTPGRRQTIRPALLAAAALAAVIALPDAGLAKARHSAHSKPPAHAKAKAKNGKAAERTAEADSPGKPFSLKPLSARDARAYASAFAAIRQGEFEAADEIAKGIDDRLLMGRLTYAKLMAPDYTSTYDELVDWLDKYKDQPDADRVYTLARKKRAALASAAAAPPPPLPDQAVGSDAATWSRVEALAERIEARLPDTAPAAAPAPGPVALRDMAIPTVKVEKALQDSREAYYKGDVAKAYKLAVAAGEQWIAGLAAFRLKNYDEAQARFASIATDETHDEWMRSGAGYWAARSAIAAGSPEAAPQFLTVAAKTPYTFYGLIAERELGLDPAVSPDGLDPAAFPGGPKGGGRTPTLAATATGAGIAKLVRDDKRARRATAFSQIGLKAEAGAELRSGLLGSTGDNRQSWMRLGLALNAPLTSPSDLTRGSSTRFDLAQFPTPELQPLGGFTLDKALVYALVRQESKFDAGAQSKSGAYGLMQLMPATAARVAGDDKLKSDPSPLLDASINLRLGQDYVARLLSAVNGDLLHAVAAYNAGPGVITKTVQQMGKEADSLLAIESMPGGQTREFVEKVVAGYWIYRNLMGQASPSLDAAASGRRAIKAALDLPTPDDSLARAARAPGELLASFLAPAPTTTGPGRPLF